MRYYVTFDGKRVMDSGAPSTEFIDPVVSVEANAAGSFVFTIPPEHAFYDSVVIRQTRIRVYLDDVIIFDGIPTSYTDDFYMQRMVSCEGSLTFFNDTIQRPRAFSGYDLSTFLQAVINTHNNNSNYNRKIYLGNVNVSGTVNCLTNYDTTMDTIFNNVIEDFGGYMVVRTTSNGARYLDYYSGSARTNGQTVGFGINLIDLSKTRDSLDVCTVVIPLGAELDTETVPGIKDRVTISSVNGGNDYLENADGVSALGKIVKVVKYDSITSPATLKSRGQRYLNSSQFDNLSVDVTAFDLSLSGGNFDDFRLLDSVRVYSRQHGLDKRFVVSKMEYHLQNPSENKLTLGTTLKKKISQQVKGGA